MFMKLSRSIPLIFACAVLEFYGTKMSRCARDCVLFISLTDFNVYHADTIQRY